MGFPMAFSQLRFHDAWEVALHGGLELHPFLRQHRQSRGRVHLRRQVDFGMGSTPGQLMLILTGLIISPSN